MSCVTHEKTTVNGQEVVVFTNTDPSNFNALVTLTGTATGSITLNAANPTGQIPYQTGICYRFTCTPIDDPDPQGVVLDCPTTTITDPTQPLTIAFTDFDPPVAPDGRVYDIWINGVDTGQGAVYPATGHSTSEPFSTYVSGTSGTQEIELRCFDVVNGVAISPAASIKTCQVTYDFPAQACIAGPNNCGRLWGVTHAASNNTEWALSSGSSDNRHAPRHAIPFRSIHDTIDFIVVNMRNDNQAGNLGGYTEGDGGTVRFFIVGDNNCEPDMSNILWTGPETVGDAAQWSSQAEFLNAYPNAQWIPSDSTGLSAQEHDVGGIAVTRCERYWIVGEQVDGGVANHSSINYFRSGYSDDFSRNWLDRTENPCADTCLLPMIQDANGNWSDLERHPIFNVGGNAGVQGMPYYNKGVGLDDEAGNDRMSNVNNQNGGDRVRNIWTVPDTGTKTLCMIHVAAALNGSNLGTGNLIVSIDGNQVASIPHTAFLVSETEVNPTALDDLRYVSVAIPPTTVSGTAIFELSSTGDVDFEIGSMQEADTLAQQQGRFYTQVGTSGTPDVKSEVSLNGGPWEPAEDFERLKHSIAYNEVADGVTSCLNEQCDCP